MPYKFFENAMNNGLSQMPNEEFRERQQAAISAQWDVTTDRFMIQEQKDIGSNEYCDIEAWIENSMGMTTRGVANGEDFRKLLFENINHKVKLGLYYKFDDNIWLTHFTDKHDSIDVGIGVRRCNNVLRMIDPENGSVFTIPCVLAYEATSPNIQVASSILTPNNHIKVLVQGNKDTFRLFKYNTRFILEGRAFKLFAFQNAIVNEAIAPLPTLLTLDLFLDELHVKDDVENQIADNGDFNYQVEIDSADIEVVNGAVGSLNASVTLNGQEVNREVVWASDNPLVAEVAENGDYKVLGREGQSCNIIAKLNGNDEVADMIQVKVVAVENITPKIIIEPMFDKVRQYQTVKFEVKVAYGDTVITPDSIEIMGANDYIFVEQADGKYAVTGKEVAPDIQKLTVKVANIEPEFKAEYELPIKVVSMMG